MVEPEPANNRGRRSTAARSRGWSDASLKPIGFALAIAIIIIAIPMAKVIAGCSKLDGGFSLTQLVSFRCEKSSIDPVVHEVTREQLAATPLNYPKGYVAYRVDSGVARASGSITPADNQPAPAFDQVQPGLVLITTAQKRLRHRPFGQSSATVLPVGECLEVETGFRFKDEPDEGGRSGGWFPARVVACSPDASRPNPEKPVLPSAGIDRISKQEKSLNQPVDKKQNNVKNSEPERAARQREVDVEENLPAPVVPKSTHVRFSININPDWCADVRGISPPRDCSTGGYKTQYYVWVDGKQSHDWTALLDDTRHIVTVTGAGADPGYNVKVTGRCDFYVEANNTGKLINISMIVKNTAMRTDVVAYNINSCSVG